MGGGDFLHYPEAGEAMMQRPRITYTSQGPNLTDVRYDYSVGLQDNIKAQVRVQTPRTDDIARHYHHFRYDVMQPASAKGMVFYQDRLHQVFH